MPDAEVEPSADIGRQFRSAKAMGIRSIVPVVTKIDLVIARR
jgi:hypothetical protein